VIDVDSSQADLLITALLAAPESRTLDVKRVSGKMVQKALETLCAFANADGGLLALGVEDPGKAKGVERIYGVEENPNAEALDELQRKVLTQFNPPIDGVRFERLPCTLRTGAPGHVVLIRVDKSDKVHSVVDGSTWVRLDASNRPMSAQESTELSYRRGVRSAESEPVPVDWALLDTAAWAEFAAARGFGRARALPEQMAQLGLAEMIAGTWQPRRAAVLLFAEEPGGLLAAQGSRAEVRLMVYKGKAVEASAQPNMRKPPRTLRGPLIRLIDEAVRTVLHELAEGVELASSGFKTQHRYPERVVKEAIVNAVVHRDYRLNRDIQIRIFDDRLEVDSPGVFPGGITPANVKEAGSKARNPLIVKTLREFPLPPNYDLNEGVPMMFSEMEQVKLYPPRYEQVDQAANQAVVVILLNEQRPPVWTQVSDWIDRNGPLGNSDLRGIAGMDVTAASRQLKEWVSQGVLEALPDRGRRNAAYTKPGSASEKSALFAGGLENKPRI
jgi:ATP-dependent DNA helicase RecG